MRITLTIVTSECLSSSSSFLFQRKTAFRSCARLSWPPTVSADTQRESERERWREREREKVRIHHNAMFEFGGKFCMLMEYRGMLATGRLTATAASEAGTDAAAMVKEARLRRRREKQASPTNPPVTPRHPHMRAASTCPGKKMLQSALYNV